MRSPLAFVRNLFRARSAAVDRSLFVFEQARQIEHLGGLIESAEKSVPVEFRRPGATIDEMVAELAEAYAARSSNSSGAHAEP